MMYDPQNYQEKCLDCIASDAKYWVSSYMDILITVTWQGIGDGSIRIDYFNILLPLLMWTMAFFYHASGEKMLETRQTPVYPGDCRQ